MDTIPNLKSKIAGYLNKEVSDLDNVNGVDLLLDAINKAHQYALMQYDFEYAKATVDVSVSLTSGAPVSPLYLHGTTDYVTVKKILRAYLSDNNGGIRPVKFSNRNTQASDVEERWNGIPFDGRDYSPVYGFYTTPWLVQQGQQLMLYPQNNDIFGGNDTVDMTLDVVRLFPDYQGSEDNTDFLLQFGDDFLFWDACCRLNKTVKEWVPREEGNLPPPTDERDKAWSDLLAWNSGLINTGDNLSLD